MRGNNAGDRMVGRDFRVSVISNIGRGIEAVVVVLDGVVVIVVVVVVLVVVVAVIAVVVVVVLVSVLALGIVLGFGLGFGVGVRGEDWG